MTTFLSQVSTTSATLYSDDIWNRSGGIQLHESLGAMDSGTQDWMAEPLVCLVASPSCISRPEKDCIIICPFY